MAITTTIRRLSNAFGTNAEDVLYDTATDPTAVEFLVKNIVVSVDTTELDFYLPIFNMVNIYVEDGTTLEKHFVAKSVPVYPREKEPRYNTRGDFLPRARTFIDQRPLSHFRIPTRGIILQTDDRLLVNNATESSGIVFYDVSALLALKFED